MKPHRKPEQIVGWLMPKPLAFKIAYWIGHRTLRALPVFAPKK